MTLELPSSPPPFDKRDAINLKILDKLLEVRDRLPADLVIGLDPISRMTSASGHPERQSAITLLKQCISDASERQLPKDLIKFGIEKALEWRSIRFPDLDSSISIEDLKSV